MWLSEVVIVSNMTHFQVQSKYVSMATHSFPVLPIVFNILMNFSPEN